MNSKGQSVVAFIIIVPIFLLLLAFIVDTGLVLNEYTKLESLTKTILKKTYEDRMQSNYLNEIKTLYKKNNISTQNIEVIVLDDMVKIENEYNTKSIFGQIIGIKKYDLKIKMKVYNENNNLKVIKE